MNLFSFSSYKYIEALVLSEYLRNGIYFKEIIVLNLKIRYDKYLSVLLFDKNNFYLKSIKMINKITSIQLDFSSLHFKQDLLFSLRKF
jgi:hypothetical protein